MSDLTPQQIEDQALSLLRWLVENFGASLVMRVLNVMTGSTAGMIIEDVSSFVADVLTIVRARVDAEKISAYLSAAYSAADVAADAVEKAKFG